MLLIPSVQGLLDNSSHVSVQISSEGLQINLHVQFLLLVSVGKN